MVDAEDGELHGRGHTFDENIVSTVCLCRRDTLAQIGTTNMVAITQGRCARAAMALCAAGVSRRSTRTSTEPLQPIPNSSPL